MKSEPPNINPNPASREQSRDKQSESRSSGRKAYRSVLIAVVIGAITLGGLWFTMSGATNPIPAPESRNKVLPSSAPAPISQEPDRPLYELFRREVETLAQRIDQGLEQLIRYSVDEAREIGKLVAGMQGIRATLNDIGKSNQDLKDRIDAARKQLEDIAKQVQSLKIAQRRAKSKPHTAKEPPFRIDAIDRWDDADYVAVSQAGRVAFLREGGTRSGWTVKHIDRVEGRVELDGPTGQHYSASPGR